MTHQEFLPHSTSQHAGENILSRVRVKPHTALFKQRVSSVRSRSSQGVRDAVEATTWSIRGDWMVSSREGFYGGEENTFCGTLALVAHSRKRTHGVSGYVEWVSSHRSQPPHEALEGGPL